MKIAGNPRCTDYKTRMRKTGVEVEGEELSEPVMVNATADNPCIFAP